MATLIHEVWEQPDEDGQMLEGLCLAGPDGDRFRASLAPGARLVSTFAAASHFEAMTKYYAMYGRGEYTTDHPWDCEPYPEDLAVLQGKLPAA
jgi:hypothetical protein